MSLRVWVFAVVPGFALVAGTSAPVAAQGGPQAFPFPPGYTRGPNVLPKGHTQAEPSGTPEDIVSPHPLGDVGRAMPTDKLIKAIQAQDSAPTGMPAGGAQTTGVTSPPGSANAPANNLTQPPAGGWPASNGPLADGSPAMPYDPNRSGTSQVQNDPLNKQFDPRDVELANSLYPAAGQYQQKIEFLMRRAQQREENRVNEMRAISGSP